MKRLKILIAVLLMSSATGCATNGQVTDDFCLLTKPIRPTTADVNVISDGLVDQILKFNELWRERCN